MKVKCPSCFAEFDILAALNNAAGSQLLQKLAALDASLSRPLYVYLTLFRSPKRALSYEKALRLAEEVLALSTNQVQLADALQKVVDALREKQLAGGFKPLKNHNYLKRVIEDVPAPVTALAHAQQPQQQSQQRRIFTSKTAQAMMDLEALKTYD